MITRFARGMVYWVNLPNWYGDNVQSGKRPCIIVSNDIGNIFSENIMVVPCTSNMNKENTQPTHYTTRVTKDTESVVLCENIFTISKKLTEGFIGLLDAKTMEEIDKCIMIALRLADIPQSVPLIPEETPTKDTKRIITKEQKQQYIQDYENYGLDYIVTKYNVASRSAAYQRYTYYKKQI